MRSTQIHLLIERRRHEEAEKAVYEALKSDPEDPELHLLLVLALFGQNKFKAAEDQARVLIGMEPDADIGHFWLARCLEERSRFKEALKAIDEALKIDPEDAESWALKASCLVAINRREEALEAVGRGLAEDPDNESCRFYRSVLLGYKGDHDEANSESLELLRNDPDAAESQNARGWVLLTGGDAEGAERHFIEALRIEPGYEDARRGLVEALQSRNFVMAAFMRFLLWLGRFPWYYVIAGIFGISALRRTLSGMENPLLSNLGDLMGIALFATFLLILTVTPIFNLVLAASKRGRLALSSREKAAVKWAVLPLLLCFYYFVSWALLGAKGFPVHCIAWAAVASLCGEVPESYNPGVRIRMACVAGAAALVAIALIFIAQFLILPELLALISDLAEQSKSDDKSTADRIQMELREALKKKKWFLDYPALAVMGAAAFRDEIRQFFERRAADV